MDEWMHGWMEQVMARRMDRWMNGWTDKKDGWRDELTEKWVDGWTDWWMDGWMVDKWIDNRWMDRQMDEWMVNRRISNKQRNRQTDGRIDGLSTVICVSYHLSDINDVQFMICVKVWKCKYCSKRRGEWCRELINVWCVFTSLIIIIIIINVTASMFISILTGSLPRW